MAENKIKELRQILAEIEKAPINQSELEIILKKVGTSLPVAGMDNLKDKCIKSLHAAIQTEMMIKACVSAKWSCFWAMIAAIAACGSIFITLCLS